MSNPIEQRLEEIAAKHWFVGSPEDKEFLLALVKRYRDEMNATIAENLHLADGDVCTLRRIKAALNFNPDAQKE